MKSNRFVYISDRTVFAITVHKILHAFLERKRFKYLPWRNVFRAKFAEENYNTHFTSSTEKSINWLNLSSVCFSLTCRMTVCCLAVDSLLTATWNQGTSMTSPSAEYCTLFRVRGCWVLERKCCAKIKNGLSERATSVPAIIYIYYFVDLGGLFTACKKP